MTDDIAGAYDRLHRKATAVEEMIAQKRFATAAHEALYHLREALNLVEPHLRAVDAPLMDALPDDPWGEINDKWVSGAKMGARDVERLLLLVADYHRRLSDRRRVEPWVTK